MAEYSEYSVFIEIIAPKFFQNFFKILLPTPIPTRKFHYEFGMQGPLWVKRLNLVSNCYLIIRALKIWEKTQPQKIL